MRLHEQSLHRSLTNEEAARRRPGGLPKSLFSLAPHRGRISNSVHRAATRDSVPVRVDSEPSSNRLRWTSAGLRAARRWPWPPGPRGDQGRSTMHAAACTRALSTNGRTGLCLGRPSPVRPRAQQTLVADEQGLVYGGPSQSHASILAACPPAVAPRPIRPTGGRRSHRRQTGRAGYSSQPSVWSLGSSYSKACL